MANLFDSPDIQEWLESQAAKMQQAQPMKEAIAALPEAKKQALQTMIRSAQEEMKLYTVPMQLDYNTDQESIEAIAKINNKFMDEKLPRLVQSILTLFPELEAVENPQEGLRTLITSSMSGIQCKANAADDEDELSETSQESSIGDVSCTDNGSAEKKKPYRTRARSNATQLSNIPTTKAYPSAKGFNYALTQYPNGAAFVMPLPKEIEEQVRSRGLKVKNGYMFYEDTNEIIQLKEIRNTTTNEIILDWDASLLRTFYDIMWKEIESDRKQFKDIDIPFTFHIEDLANYLGIKKTNKDTAEIIQRKARQYHNFLGVIESSANGRTYRSYYQLLNFESYDSTFNTITISSPYLKYMVKKIYVSSFWRDDEGKPVLNSNGTAKRLPVNSYLLKPDFESATRNTAAKDNVCIIITLIEQAGFNVPRIKARTIVDRNPALAQRIKNSANPRTLIKSVFVKTLELLRDHTRLQECYANIQLPDPNNPANIPTTPASLDDVVLAFPHDGKILQSDKRRIAKKAQVL